jgi:hypothetical protein
VRLMEHHMESLGGDRLLPGVVEAVAAMSELKAGLRARILPRTSLGLSVASLLVDRPSRGLSVAQLIPML